MLVYRVIEDFLGLERKESERYLETIRQQLLSAPPSSSRQTQPADAGPTALLSLPLEKYSRTYHDAGYGNFTFCAPTPHPDVACAPVLEAWSYFENTTDTSRRVLYAAVSSVWISHFRLVHKDGDTFGLEGTHLFPHGYGHDTSPFYNTGDGPRALGTTEFWVGGEGEERRVLGAAINGLVGEMTERQRAGGSLADTAEIWLQRL